MTVRSLTNQIIGLSRDLHKAINKWSKRGYPLPTPGKAYKDAIIEDLMADGYFNEHAVENFAEALVVLMETSTPKRKKNETT